ncbi:MAG: DNA-binding protein [Candidatus Hadarchaeum sp.]|jgi:hypothetical protein|nr:DNA-binding protein [Candidatus Hadarchaeum sp.]
MKKAFIFVAILLTLMAPLASSESGQALIENANSFDGKTVTFRGEVIGVMTRGDYAWVNILDGDYAIGVWCRAVDAKKVSFIGDYSHTGDTVEVAGTFHLACTEHGGDLDIHADNFAIVAQGREVDRSTSLPLAALSIVLASVAIFITFYLWRIRNEKQKILPWPSY